MISIFVLPSASSVCNSEYAWKLASYVHYKRSGEDSFMTLLYTVHPQLKVQEHQLLLSPVRSMFGLLGKSFFFAFNKNVVFPITLMPF